MMLGRLARWMRILGVDVLYLNPVDDRELIRISRRDKRILLTRDTRLVQRRGVGEHLLIRENKPMAQLEEVIRVYPPAPDRILTRCIRCNTRLTASEKTDVRDEVPEYIYHTASGFGRCRQCGRVYWEGSHCRRMIETCRRYLNQA
jgi:uncharacterized protein with PIN domain